MKVSSLLFCMILFYSTVSHQLAAQCSKELFSGSARSKAKGYTFIKSYRIDGRGGKREKIRYIAVLNPETSYRMIIDSKDGGSHGLIITVYNSDGEIVASNYQNGKFNQATDFKVDQTGIYSLIFTFKDSKSYCALARLVFHRN